MVAIRARHVKFKELFLFQRLDKQTNGEGWHYLQLKQRFVFGILITLAKKVANLCPQSPWSQLGLVRAH